MAVEPGPDLGSFVGTVVVHHQMQRHFTEKLVQTAQKLQPLLMSMPCIALTDNPARKTSKAANRVAPRRL